MQHITLSHALAVRWQQQLRAKADGSLQAFKPDVVIADMYFPACAALADKFGVPKVLYGPAGVRVPFCLMLTTVFCHHAVPLLAMSSRVITLAGNWAMQEWNKLHFTAAACD